MHTLTMHVQMLLVDFLFQLTFNITGVDPKTVAWIIGTLISLCDI